MRSYTRFRKLPGGAMSRVLGRPPHSILMLAALVVALSLPGEAQRTPPAESEATLFQNVRIFDGKSSSLSTSSNVLVRGNKIERISTGPIAVDAGARVIDGGGRTLMPGLIDVHWHAMLIRVTPAESFGDVGYNNLIAGAEAEDTLMRGFTTVRDVGGPVFGLKHAIDNGTVVGPRICVDGDWACRNALNLIALYEHICGCRERRAFPIENPNIPQQDRRTFGASLREHRDVKYNECNNN